MDPTSQLFAQDLTKVKPGLALIPLRLMAECQNLVWGSPIIIGKGILNFFTKAKKIRGVTYTYSQDFADEHLPGVKLDIITKDDFANLHAKFYILDLPDKKSIVLVGSHNFVRPTLFDVSVGIVDTNTIKLFSNLHKQLKAHI